MVTMVNNNELNNSSKRRLRYSIIIANTHQKVDVGNVQTYFVGFTVILYQGYHHASPVCSRNSGPGLLIVLQYLLILKSSCIIQLVADREDTIKCMSILSWFLFLQTTLSNRAGFIIPMMVSLQSHSFGILFKSKENYLYRIILQTTYETEERNFITRVGSLRLRQHTNNDISRVKQQDMIKC